MAENGQVRIGREFFSKIRLDYADWRWALVREFMQNCMDAPAASLITVAIEAVGGNTRLIVRNNGAPMDRDVLINKLLTLGGSGKNFDGGVGGFGVAKSLLYYTHLAYRIKTGSLRVQGEGAQYSISTGETFHGTESEVLVEGNHVEALIGRFRNFAAMAQWSGKLIVNEDKLTCSMKKGARRKDLGWGVVYSNNSFANLCIVRLNGQPMFSMYCRYKGCILVELVGKSSDILTSNRDGLKGKHASELNDLLTAIAVDKKSALKEQKAEYKRWLGEKQKNEAKRPKEVEGGLAAALGTKDLAKAILGTTMIGVDVANGNDKSVEAVVNTDGTTAEMPTQGVGGIKMTIVSNEEGDKSVSLGPEFIIKNTTGQKVPVHYQPGEKFSKYARDLVRAWCGCLLKLYQLLNKSGEFSVGFIFDEDSVAQHEVGPYGRVYYLNPTKIITEPKFHMEARYASAWKDRHDIIASAAHEVVHGAYGLKEHDEDYAGTLTDVMTICLRGIREIEPIFRPERGEDENTNLPKQLHRSDLMGHPMTAVVRWMGKDMWSFDDARAVLSHLKIEIADGTIRTQLRAGEKGERGDPAALTLEQVDELYNIRASV